MNRFSKLAISLPGIATLIFVTGAAAQQPLPKGLNEKDIQRMQFLINDYKRLEPLVVTKIKDTNIYLAKGGPAGNDANMGFVVGKDGVTFVDNKNTPESEKQVLAEMAKITPNPVNTVIILHSDNEFGITALPPGMTIIAQENTKKEIEESTAKNAVTQPFYPNKLIAKDEKMTIDGVRVRFLHWANAHTSGDLFPYFPDQKVVFCGDVIVTDFPLTGTQIHPTLHGSVAGWLETVKGLLALNADTYVSGHGDLFTKSDIRIKYLLMQDKWDKMKALVAQGKSLEQVEAALGEPTGPQSKPTPGVFTLPLPNVTTEVIYNEMTAKTKD
jgi:glyoxylase-like metal-dependent hydrolase (beta-lactamase superfamily II)